MIIAFLLHIAISLGIGIMHTRVIGCVGAIVVATVIAGDTARCIAACVAAVICNCVLCLLVL